MNKKILNTTGTHLFKTYHIGEKLSPLVREIQPEGEE